eukprot:m.31369 g.31369  ORF g.31369 m.31369 type:complete len:116 (+) comp4796_c0_seq1:130-477(+)
MQNNNSQQKSRARGVASAMGKMAVAAARTSVKGAGYIASKAASKRKGVTQLNDQEEVRKVVNATPEVVRDETKPQQRTYVQKTMRGLELDFEAMGDGSPMANQEHADIPRSYGTI